MSLKVVWNPRARARLREIRAFVANDKDKPDAVARLATRMVAVIEALREHPYLSRAGAEPGTPYIVSYWLEGERVTISTIRHGAQRR